MGIGEQIVADTDQNIRADDGKWYTSGFHIFRTKRGVVRYAKQERIHDCCMYVVRVAYEYVLATGTQGGAQCVVALKMRVVADLGVLSEFVKNVR